MQNKLKKITFLTFVIAFSFSSSGLANAQETGASSAVKPMPEKRGEMMRKEIRAELRDTRGFGSTTPGLIKREIKMGSSSEMFKKRQEMMKGQLEKRMEKKSFQTRKDALVKELTMAVENLTNIAARIAERIVKAEANGKTLTDAKASLSTANTKLTQAKTAIAALAAYTPATAAPETGTTTIKVEIEKARQVGDAAIKAVREARDSLKKVLSDIAHAMGQGSDNKKMMESTSTSETNQFKNL